MPKVITCHKYMKNGYKYGKDGTCYLYAENDPGSRSRAFQRALEDQKKAEAAKKDRMGSISK